MYSVFVVGTYGKDDHQGIVRLSYDFANHTALPPEIEDTADQASYLCRYGAYVYALSETPGEGALHAFRIEGERLRLLNRRKGVEPILAHLSASPDGHLLYRISYSTGEIGTYLLGQDGSLQTPAGYVRNVGCGPFSGRQRSAHGHSITPTPDGRHAIACDLGTDQVLCLSVDPQTGALQVCDSMSLRLPGGTGPRQQCWSQDGTCLYVVTEMGYQIAALSWSPETGLALLDCRDIRPDMPKVDREGAAVKVSPDDRFVYTSCRLDGMLDCFAIGSDHIPTRRFTVSSQVEQPRDFLITRDGKHLLAAGQRSNDISVFDRDPGDGSLRFVDRIVGIEKPVCLMEL